ncbi:GNAT family N-acetyltransferase [uncultured Sphingomonas sp.]|uniref:GNAT family N-acetyltransferase n=1 Tax=uncultured Sphingomonas sp. TaxID=158754 RepID=UPI0035C9A807
MRPPFMLLAALLSIQPLAAVPDTAIEALLDRAFGADRRGRTAYKVRGAARAIPALSFAALEGETLIGSIQCWPVRFAADAGEATPLVMVGPVAVEPERQRDGVGQRLMQAALGAAAREDLDDRLVLIGDPEYYERFFGFSAARTGGWRLPGPVERHRLLARGVAIPAAAGVLGPA